MRKEVTVNLIEKEKVKKKGEERTRKDRDKDRQIRRDKDREIQKNGFELGI